MMMILVSAMLAAYLNGLLKVALDNDGILVFPLSLREIIVTRHVILTPASPAVVFKGASYVGRQLSLHQSSRFKRANLAT